MCRTIRAAAFAVLVSASPALAQTIWTPIEHRPALLIEALHPNLKTGSGVDVSVLSGALFVTGTLPAGDRAMLVAEIPYARSKVSFDGESSSQSAFGNPYIGVQLGRATGARGFVAEAGVRIPVIGENDFEAAEMGALSDFDRLYSFVNDVTTLSVDGNFYSHVQQAKSRLRLGVSHLLYGKDSGDDDTVLDYGALVSGDLDRLRLGGAVTGHYILTESGNFGDRSIHQGTGSASVSFGQLRPGILVRVPFDKDIRESVSSMIGLTLEYSFR